MNHQELITELAAMASQGDAQALALIVALATESLERRADPSLGIHRTEQEWNDRLKFRIKRVDTLRGWCNLLHKWQDFRGSYSTAKSKKRYNDLIRMITSRLFDQL